MPDFDRPASDGTASEPPERGSPQHARPPWEPAGPEGSGRLPSEPVQPEPRGGKRTSGSSFLRELPVLLLIAFVLAFLLRTFVVQVFYIPSSSMEPTLQINDRMVVEKVTYQFREPRHGEIAVFEGDELGTVPDNGAVQRAVRGVGQFIGIVPASARDFVKRVIGLPGDEVLIEAGQVYVNGEPLGEDYVVYDDEADFGPVTVPEDRLFFLGDNRPNSSDSRRSLGFVPTDQLVGRAAVIIWPFDNAGTLTGVEHDVPARAEARDPDDAELPAEDEDGEASEPSTGEPDGVDESDDDASAAQTDPRPAF